MRNTGKQRKKRSREKDIIIPRRILSVIMALVLCVGLYPAWAYAEESVSGPCVHHRPHTRDCGYKEAEPGHECAHVHTEDCYRTVEEEDGSTAERLDCHHEHDDTCGYIPETEDGEGSLCTYACRICPVERLIAALPDAADITEDNADEVRTQLEEILALFAELTEDEQEQIDLSRCYALQEALDGANAPDLVAGEVSVDYQEATWDGSSKVTYAAKTAENCAVVKNSTEAVTWTAGWYAVNGSVTISEPVTVSGAVSLILTDGCTLNAERGIVVTSTNSLTIYAQSEDGGTLNATGTTDDSGNASAGIGGGTDTSSLDSGSITIHGGVINATGGASNWYGGAGIGGSTPSSGNGDSGAVTIYGGTITADSGEGNITGAGIGGGGGNANGGSGGNLTIYDGNVTAESHGNSNGGSGAGIGGGFGTKEGGTGNITIHGGTVRATGSERGAGIGGGGAGIGANYASGSGTVNISGGTVTAVGGIYAAGIGGGGGYSAEFMGNTVTCTGGTGTVNITGGIVDAKGGEGNASGDYAGDPIGNGGNASGTAAVTKTTGIVFENGVGTVYGDVTLDGNYAVPAGCSLHIPAGASLSGSGTLTGGGTFTTENLTEDMVSVPDGIYYNGKDRTEEIAGKVAVDGGITLCGKTFAVSGWKVEVAKTDDLTYTATYTNESDSANTFMKTITLRQSGTQFVGSGVAKTYKDNTECANFTAGDTITVRTTPTATGAAPRKAARQQGGFGEPTAGQMAVSVDSTQVSEAASAGADGSYTMTVSAADVLRQGQKGQDGKFTLTVKFVENNNMAGAETTVKVTVVPDPLTADMVTLSAAGAIYNGAEQKPTITVKDGGVSLAEGTDYDITCSSRDFTNAGTVQITVTGKGIYAGTVKKTFAIEKAAPTVAWAKDEITVAYTGQPANVKPTVTLVNNQTYSGAIHYEYGNYSGSALPTNAGTYKIKAGIAEQENYKAAASEWLTLRIDKASAPAITYPAAGSITYGQRLSDSALTGGSTKYGTFAWESGTTVPTVNNTGYTVVFTASEETEQNYEAITDVTKKVPVRVEQAVPAVSVRAALSGGKDSRQAVLTADMAKAGAGAFPTGTVTFVDCTDNAGTELGTAALNSDGTASYTWNGLSGKTYTIKAVYTGDSNYKEAESRVLTFDAAKQNQQNFSLDAIGDKTYGDAAITLKTTGGNGGGAVSYESSDEKVIRIEDDRAVIVGAGTATVTAVKEGDSDYNEASADRYVIVGKKALTVTAENKTVAKGNPMPALTWRADGLVNGDTFTTAPAVTAGAQNTNTLGKYDIAISGGTLRNGGSYRITYVNGTLRIVERLYTVTVTDGAGGGEYAEGDTVTVTAHDRSGYTFTGWSSGDGVVFADSRARTATFIMPAKSVTVKADYTRNSGGSTGGSDGSGNSGGNSGGSGNSGGKGSGSKNPVNGNTAPQSPVIPPAENTGPGNGAAPGTGKAPTNPGNGNTAGQKNGAGVSMQGIKQPFIKGADGKIGWDVIRAEEEKAKEGSTINVDMNGSTVVPRDIFDRIKGKDITVTFDMGSGILWSVDGKSVTGNTSPDSAGDIDFSVKTGVDTVPVDIVNNVTGERYSIQISLAFEGEFGFTAVLSIDLGKENAGYTASLYYYNENTGELEFICADEVSADGTASLAFTHASDYVIAIDGDGEEGDSAVESAQPDEKGGTAGNGTVTDKNPQEGQPWGMWLMAVIGVAVISVSAGVYFIVRKKKDEESE